MTYYLKKPLTTARIASIYKASGDFGMVVSQNGGQKSYKKYTIFFKTAPELFRIT